MLDDVRAVWYRKPTAYDKAQVPVPAYYVDYATSSLTRHFGTLRAEFSDALWVSDYYAIGRAENKLLQYRIATKVGFRVPATLLTSNDAAAADFVKRHQRAVVKTLSSINPAGTMFPTTLLDSAKPVKLEGLKLAPAIFQVAIDPAIELRVTVIGREVFVAGIVDDGVASHPNLRDWRFNEGTDKNTFEPYTKLTPEVRQACLDLVQTLGLQYGAIDLIIDKKGVVWFLEINPNGQWAFIEEETGLPLGKCMADLLSGTSLPL